eukprot:gene2406-3249_t
MPIATGARAEDARRSPADVQQELTRRGFDAGPADGKWSKRSEKALQAFQKSVGIEATGIIDGPTLHKLFAATPAPAATAVRAPSAKPAGQPGYDPATLQLMALYRLATTGVGACHPADFDAARIEAELQRRLGDRKAGTVALLRKAGASEITGTAYLDDIFAAQSCAGWTQTASRLGLVTQQPLADITGLLPPSDKTAAIRSPTVAEPAEPEPHADVRAAGDGGADHEVEMAFLGDIERVAVVGAEREEGREPLCQDRHQRVQVLRYRAFTHQDMHALADLFHGFGGRRAFVVGADA